MNRKSKRFTPSKMSTYLVPALLLLILLGLVATLIIVAITSAGV
jgi:hypothetical protein